MEVHKRMRVTVMILLAFLIGVSTEATGWAQMGYSSNAPEARGEMVGTQVLATVAGTVGSVFYIPFKAAAICPGMALAAGITMAANWGRSDSADYLLRLGCTGTYFITPGMIRGQEEFQGSGYPEPDTSVPATGPR